jgi:argininosuccinate lyase
MKLWDKGTATEKQVEIFTVGNDQELDQVLARYDVLGSLAHGKMLEKVGILDKSELAALEKSLKDILLSSDKGEFSIADSFEDIHSQVEYLLTEAIGDIGKKIHTGRSRNDQVLVDIKMYLRDEIKEIATLTHQLFSTLINLSDQHKDVIIPGYTHLQIAMPSSFGLWFGSYAEALTDDLNMLQAAYQMVNQNPLGSAAGYGSSFPLDREMTTRLLGFKTMHYNVVNAQMARGKTEKFMAFGMASLSATLSKLAMDACLYNSQNFGFITFPDHLTTGSSIMPHKKNPDVFELIRGKCNKIQALPLDITLIINNLPSGYHREFQILKDTLFPAIQELKSCLQMADLMLSNIKVNTGIVNDQRYDYIYSVEAVHHEVSAGLSFREAYKRVGQIIEKGEYVPDKTIRHTHEGSIGNLCNEKIREKMENSLTQFNFAQYEKALEDLIK